MSNGGGLFEITADEVEGMEEAVFECDCGLGEVGLMELNSAVNE